MIHRSPRRYFQIASEKEQPADVFTWGRGEYGLCTLQIEDTQHMLDCFTRACHPSTWTELYPIKVVVMGGGGQEWLEPSDSKATLISRSQRASISAVSFLLGVPGGAEPGQCEKWTVLAIKAQCSAAVLPKLEPESVSEEPPAGCT